MLSVSGKKFKYSAVFLEGKQKSDLLQAADSNRFEFSKSYYYLKEEANEEKSNKFTISICIDAK